MVPDRDLVRKILLGHNEQELELEKLYSRGSGSIHWRTRILRFTSRKPKEDKTTSRLDAAAQYYEKCHNDSIISGPPLQTLLPAVL